MIRIASVTLGLFAMAACGGLGAPRASIGATLEGTVQGPATALTVEVPGTTLSTRTDTTGHFALLDVPEGEHELHFKGQGVDARLQLGALSRHEHRKISVSVSGQQAIQHHEASEVELRGTIDSIAAPSFLVGGKTVTTTTATKFRRSGAAIAFTDLDAGQSVEAEGALQQDGSLLARSVTVEDAAAAAGGADAGDDSSHVEDLAFAGTLNAIADGKLTVGTTVVTTTAATRIEKADQLIAATALALGDELRVEGALQADGSVVAKEIHVFSTAESAEQLVAGAVTAVSTADQTLTIGTTVIRVDGHTSFHGEGSFASLADVHAGDLIDVEAAKQSDGSLLALRVERLGQPEINEVEVKGAIEKVDASSIQVQGKSFSVDASTRIQRSGNAVQLTSLAVGQIAEVRGTSGSDGALHATRISLESGH